MTQGDALARRIAADPTGTRVTATDLDSGESETKVIRNDYIVICDGDRYIDGMAVYANGTVVVTIKREAPNGDR